MSDNAFRQIHEALLADADAFFKVKASKTKFDKNYKPNRSDMIDLISRQKAKNAFDTSSFNIVDYDIIEGGNVVLSIQDNFVNRGDDSDEAISFRIVSMTKSDISKLKALAKKLPDDSRKQFEEMIEELGER